MYILKILLSMILAYLAGSINFAILISRWAKGIDIRTVGNKNPGTSNVGRMVGKGWATLVFTGDLAKGLIPLILAKTLFFTQDHYADYFPLFLTGMMAIAGHCWSLFHRFKGGGGLATSIGIYMFFIPVEFFITLFISFLIVVLFFRNAKYSIGQITPMFFVSLTPIFLILSNVFIDKNLYSSIGIGGHPWYVITGIIALSLYIFMINIKIVLGRLSKEKSV
jgi:glycerol-3-phosphate acyltransferase PlsY